MATVYVVDDEPTICELVEAFLADLGHAARCFADALEALAAAVRHPPALVVADYMMPGLDGLALAAALRERGVAAPVVLMTAVPERVAGLGEAPVAAVLPKPFDLADLEAAVQQVLGA